MPAVQCARTSPCAHARHMARRLALLALLACVVIARRPPDPSSDLSDSDLTDSDSMEPLLLFDDYESFEPTPPPRSRATKSSSKVILRRKGTKVNVTMKNPKSENKKNYQKSTTINIESHTNFIMTKRPPVIKPMHVTNTPKQENEEDYGWVEELNTMQVSTPGAQRRTTTRRPSTRRRPSTSTRRTTTTRTPKRTPKPTKKLQTKKTTCQPNRSVLLSNYFQDNKFKKASKKPAKSGWFKGRFQHQFKVFKKGGSQSLSISLFFKCLLRDYSSHYVLILMRWSYCLVW